MGTARKPRPLDLGAVHVRAIRPPSKRAPEWYWRAVRYVNGREETVWTGRASREEAERTVAALVAGGDLGPREKVAEVRTVRDLLECWVGAQEQRHDLAAHTFRGYKQAAGRVAEGMGDAALHALHRGTLERYRDQRLRAGGAPSTVGLEYQVMRSAWRWGQDLGFCPHHRLPTLRLPKESRYSRHTPSRGDVAQVLAALEGWQRVAVLLLYATGARPGEVTFLRWGDLDLDAGLVHLGRHEGARKTGERTIPIRPEVVRELRAWGPGEPGALVLRDQPETAKAVLGFYLRRACEQAGIEPWSPMGLRRLAEDELYRRVGDPSAAAAMLGHSPEMALKHYRRATADDLRRAMETAELGKVPAGEVIALEPRTRTAHKTG